MNRIIVNASMTMLGTLVLCGCLVGHQEFDLANIHNYTLPTSGIANNQKVIIDAVIDKRKFSTRRDSSPAVPAVGYGALWTSLEDTPEIRKCLIGRLDRGDGRAAGDLMTKDHYTVESYFRKLIEEALRQANFEIVTSHNITDDTAWHLNASIEQFWTSPKDTGVFQTRTELEIDMVTGSATNSIAHNSRDVLFCSDRYGKVLEQNADMVVKDLVEKFLQISKSAKGSKE